MTIAVRRAALACWLLASAPLAAHADAPCRTQVMLTPESAWVGQEVVYRLRIFRRAEVTRVRFAEALSFPSLRAEWLPGQRLDPAIEDIGEHELVVEERRAIFPARAGMLAIPAASIECETADGETIVPIEATSLDVRELPAKGRPEDFVGLVGPVRVGAALAARGVELGDAVALTVRVWGPANVWEVADPLAGVTLSGVSIHAEEPQLEREPGVVLQLQRRFVYRLVPRQAGRVEIPALRVPWFDPQTGRYEVATTPALPLVVIPNAAANATPREPRRAAEPAAAPRDWRWLAILLGAGAAAGAVVTGGIALRRRRAASGAAAGHLEDARDAAARRDERAEVAALAAALRAAIEARAPGARSRTAEEIAATAGGAVRDAALALADLDRARFAPPGATPRVDAARIHALIREL